jgi:hypothetical protein
MPRASRQKNEREKETVMAAPGTRAVTNPNLVPPTDEAITSGHSGTPAAESAPNTAAIAREAAAIYPDTNEGRPTPEEIAVEAYRIYMGRGAHEGRDLDDWLEAERRLSQDRRSRP